MLRMGCVLPLSYSTSWRRGTWLNSGTLSQCASYKRFCVGHDSSLGLRTRIGWLPYRRGSHPYRSRRDERRCVGLWRCYASSVARDGLAQAPVPVPCSAPQRLASPGCGRWDPEAAVENGCCRPSAERRCWLWRRYVVFGDALSTACSGCSTLNDKTSDTPRFKILSQRLAGVTEENQ